MNGALPAGVDVSRETLDALQHYGDMLRKWTQTINLISKDSRDAIWQRHIADSAQLAPFIPPDAAHWVDIGSGGGLPGIVIGITAQKVNPALRLTLIESDQRKCVFLRQAIRAFSLDAIVLNGRIADFPPQNADMLSARALAPMTDLLEFAALHLGPDGTALFMKGRSHEAEIAEARTKWGFDCIAHPSQTDANARILAIRNITRVAR